MTVSAYSSRVHPRLSAAPAMDLSIACHHEDLLATQAVVVDVHDATQWAASGRLSSWISNDPSSDFTHIMT